MTFAHMINKGRLLLVANMDLGALVHQNVNPPLLHPYLYTLR